PSAKLSLPSSTEEPRESWRACAMRCAILGTRSSCSPPRTHAPRPSCWPGASRPCAWIRALSNPTTQPTCTCCTRCAGLPVVLTCCIFTLSCFTWLSSRVSHTARCSGLLAEVRPGVHLRLAALSHSLGPLACDRQTRPGARSLPPTPVPVGLLSGFPRPHLAGERCRPGHKAGTPGGHSAEDRGEGRQRGQCLLSGRREAAAG